MIQLTNVARFFCITAALALVSFETPCQTSQASAPSASPSSERPITPSVAALQTTLPEMVPNPDGTGVMLAHAKESFSEITLKGSELKPAAPLLGSKEERPDFIRELYQVQWRPNDPVDLYVIRPIGVKNPPVAIFLYGFPSETSRFKDDSWCQRATHGSVAVIGFVSAYTGHRDDHKPAAENFITKLPEALATTTHDVQMVLNYLATRGDLDMSRVGIFGQGSGATIAILAGAADHRIKSIDLLDPWGDWPVWLAGAQDVPSQYRSDVLKPEFQKALEPLEPLHYLPELKSLKIRIQFEKDQGEPQAAIDKLVAAAPPTTQVVTFPNARRMYSANSAGRLFEWLGEALGATAVPSASGTSANTQPTSPSSPK